MRQRFLSVLATGLFLLCVTGMANATLTTIGTASYGSSNYKLIYDADSPFGPITWLDYTNDPLNWQGQMAWVAGLNGSEVITYNLNPGVIMNWSGGWRLPATVDGVWEYGCDGTTTAGYNITSSEMGHLYYTELRNIGQYATDGTYLHPGWGLQKTGDFDNLVAAWYWSGTEYAEGASVHFGPDFAWFLDMRIDVGFQNTLTKIDHGLRGLAVRPGQVVPLPGAVWLLGSGLTGLVALGRRRKT